ncbi:MAG: hypothetical protein DKINENOH_02624 [bacterium]|nr:hypothetical protein [bacterium]
MFRSFCGWARRLVHGGLVALLALAGLPVNLSAQVRVVGYYPAWMKTKLPAARMQFQYLTHLNHAFAWPLADGSIASYAELNHPELIQETHRAGKKILIALGGWGQSDGFAAMSADSAARARFIGNLVDFCASRGYDGADFDWEFPRNATERANLTRLIKEVRQAFVAADKGWLLTMVAVTSNWSGQWHDYAALAREVDWFNLMAYDFHGSWTNHAGHNAPLFAPASEYDGSAHQGILYLRDQRGVPKEKIHLGVPFYGREFNATRLYGPSTGGTDVEYGAIPARLNAGWEYFWDDVAKVPYLLNTGRTKFLTFDDSVSLRHKCEYIKQNRLGGAMIWALGQDVFNNTQPLLEAMGRALNPGVAVAASTPATLEKFELFQNYPNPFNPATTIVFSLAADAAVKLTIYSLTGEQIAVLVDGLVTRGRHAFTWEAVGHPSGVYFVQLEVAGAIAAEKMTLVR